MRQAVVDLASQPIRNLCDFPRGHAMPPLYGTTSASNVTMVTSIPAGAPNGATTAIKVTAASGQNGNQGIRLTRKLNADVRGRVLTMQADIYVYDAATSLGFALAAQVAQTSVLVPVGVWTRMTWTSPAAITSADTAAAVPGIRAPASPANYLVTNIMVREGTTPTGYADGDTPGWRWVGTPTTSESIGYPYTLESIAGRPAAVNTTPNTLVSAPIPAMQGRTLYVAHEVVTTTSASRPFASYGASTANTNAEAGAMVFRTGASGTSVYTNRIQTSGGTTFRDSLTGARTVGRHVGVAWVNSGLTTVGIEVDGAYTWVSSMVPGTGLNPTGSLALAPDTTPTEDRPIAAYLFAAEHDTTTRRRVTAWLARMYGTPIPVGY